MFWHNEEFSMGLGKDICLDGVVCVVDCVFGKKVLGFLPWHPPMETYRLLSKWKMIARSKEKAKVYGNFELSLDILC